MPVAVEADYIRRPERNGTDYSIELRSPDAGRVYTPESAGADALRLRRLLALP